MFKRRPLNKNNSNSNGAANKSTQQGSPQPPQQSQGQQQQQQSGRAQHPSRQRHKSRQNNQGQAQHGQGLGQNQNPNQQQKQQGRPRHHNRNNNQGRRHRPQAPPPFIQRDVLLIANKEHSATIEQVRAKFDPLCKKIPAHVTVLFSESADKINREILKKMDLGQLPSVKTITFNSVEIINDKYLWLIPDEESSQKLRTWHDEFRKHLPDNHTQGEKYEPHLTLGYIPRKTPEEEALAFARNLITTPLTVNFESVLLEEFSEDQNSRSLDRLQIAL